MARQKKAPLRALKSPQGGGLFALSFPTKKVLEVESILSTAAVLLIKLTLARHFNFLVR